MIEALLVLRLVTYNLNFGIAGDGATIDALAHADGDVVLLQETNRTWEAALIRALGDRYPWRRFEHRGAAGGIAVLSKHPITKVEILEPSVEGGWFPAMWIVVKTPAGPLQLLNVHLRPQLSESGSVVSGYFSTPAIREAEMTAFAKKLDPDLPAFIGGDFNESTSGRATSRMVESGFVDVVDQLAPETETWRWNTSVGKIESSLDRVLYRPRDGLKAIDARVLKKGRSDHLPVVTIFEMVPAT
jgi:endonuclease/exonuclease/phosphatase (EEP) superfamily protein YafD